MASALLDWALGIDSHKAEGYSIAPGVVKDNTNFLLEATVQVHIPSLPSFDPWARMVSVGAGSGRGFMWIPQIDDEVLVAFNQNDERDAYILGGLWNTVDRPPTANPADFMTKRIIQTGVEAGVGHTVEFDDALQSVKITTSTKQQISIDPKSIEISTTAGSLKISLNLAGTPPGISIQALAGNIELTAPQGKISLTASQFEVLAAESIDMTTFGDFTMLGLPIKLN